MLFLSSVPVTRGRAMHILRVAFKDSLERLFRTAVWTRISSCLSSSGACPALLFLPLPQSSAPDPQALFGGVASSFHSGSAGTVCRPQKSIGTRAEGLSTPGSCGTLLSGPFPSRGSSNPLLALSVAGPVQTHAQGELQPSCHSTLKMETQTIWAPLTQEARQL